MDLRRHNGVVVDGCPPPRTILCTPHDSNMKIRKAAKLSTLLTACNLPQLTNSLCVDAAASSTVGSRSLSFVVGFMTKSVKGMTDPRSTPPTSHHISAPINQAALALKNPTTASGACISVAFL